MINSAHGRMPWPTPKFSSAFRRKHLCRPSPACYRKAQSILASSWEHHRHNDLARYLQFFLHDWYHEHRDAAGRSAMLVFVSWLWSSLGSVVSRRPAGAGLSLPSLPGLGLSRSIPTETAGRCPSDGAEVARRFGLTDRFLRTNTVSGSQPVSLG